MDGTEAHVHLAVTIPPTVLPSEFVGRLKGYSSHTVNDACGLVAAGKVTRVVVETERFLDKAR